jgi:transcriptional regulator with XRE-family HTH domain
MNFLEVRVAAGFTQQSLANALTEKTGKKFYPSAIATWELGQCSPASEVIIPLAAVLGLDTTTVLISLEMSRKEKPRTIRIRRRPRKKSI